CAAEIPDRTVRIGVLTDMGGANADASGEGSVVAAKLAAEDAAKFMPGITVSVIGADHQNKADVASSIARDWITNQAINVITDVPVSSAGLAVAETTRGQPRTVFIPSGTGASDLTGKRCSPNTLHWTYDSYANGSVVARALSEEGAKTWFFITADYALGHALQRDTSGVITSLGGTVLGAALHPNFNSDFSSQLLSAQTSGADVIALANATGDLVNTIKQAREFSISGGKQRFAATVMMITDVQALGLETAQGLYLAEPFYWDLNDGTRAFSARFAERMRGRKPTMIQAGVYSGVLNYLKAVHAVDSTEVAAITAELRRNPPDDPVLGKAIVRRDGRVTHDFYLFQVKRPDQSIGAWDDYTLVRRIPGDVAFRPIEEGGCPLVPAP
ncbi:MAG: ABC transporter substrate-binding protein, partial [Janthinobacterium lividum]